MIFKSKYTDERFFSKMNRDFYDKGYHEGLVYRSKIDKIAKEELK